MINKSKKIISDSNTTKGVYAIVNTRTHKMYIGSSFDIDRRWREHKTALEQGKHYNSYLQRAYNINKKAFQYVILEVYEGDNREELYMLEQKYVNENVEDIYNFNYDIVNNKKGNRKELIKNLKRI